MIMEVLQIDPGGDILKSFSWTVSSYLNQLNLWDEDLGSDITSNTQRPTPSVFSKSKLTTNLLRKHDRPDKFPPTYDFSFPSRVGMGLESSIDKKSDGIMEVVVMPKLTYESKNWPMHIEKCTFLNDWIRIFLERQFAFKKVLSAALTQGANYGQHPQKNQAVIVSSDVSGQENYMDLSQLRVFLVKKTSNNLLELMGYNVTDTDTKHLKPNINIFITSKSNGIPANCKRLICGAVLNAKHNTKECQLLAEDYRRLRLNDMKTMCQPKCSRSPQLQVGWEEILSNLQDAAVKIDLLCIKPGHTVAVNFENECMKSRVTKSKGASFMMYNCARISEMLRQFHVKVSEGFYPPLVPIEEVDFSLLTYEEEWELLFSFILRYPSLIEECVASVEEGSVRPDNVCNFLNSMCSCFSVYYRRIRILTEPRKHLLPTMFARLYLLRGIEQVLHNALRVLDISPISQM